MAIREHSKDSSIAIGRNAGEHILKEMDGAKKCVKIVSPYLTASYVDKLIDLQKKGIEVTLITSDDVEKDFSGKYSPLCDQDLIQQIRHEDTTAEQRRKQWLIAAICQLILGVGFFFVPVVGVVVGILLLLSGTGSFIYRSSIAVFTYEYVPTFKQFRVFISPGNRKNGMTYQEYKAMFPHGFFVHAKIYVIDDRTAFVGSVNYTYAGLKMNYETCVQVWDKKAVLRISDEVFNLYHNKNLPFRNLQEWGRSIYPEPKN